MKIMFCAGGTGGHIYPAIAVADALRTLSPDIEILFAGTPSGMESRLVPSAGYPFVSIPMQGIRRSLSLKNIKAVYLTLRALGRARQLLDREQPELLFGTGGYVCYPILSAGAKRGIPVFLHESNAVPGLAVKRLAGRASTVFCAFEETARNLKGVKTEAVGTPLRSDFCALTRGEARRRLALDGSFPHLLLSFGGSLGASTLNDAVLAVMQQVSARHPGWLHLHITGNRDFERCREQLQATVRPNLRLMPYCNDLPLWMAAADLVICRAGATTVAELQALQKAAILVPSPYVANNHQAANAAAFCAGGAGVTVAENGQLRDTLCETVSRLLSDRAALLSLQARAGSEHATSAAPRIARKLLAVCRGF